MLQGDAGLQLGGIAINGVCLVDGKHIKIFILKLECRALSGGAGARGWESMGFRAGFFCLSVERRGLWGGGPWQG